MQKLQLYIEGTRIDLFNDENVTLTQTIQNVRDISKIFTDFSKSFTIPASKTNNKIFSHYYNFDIVGGFDGRKKIDAEIHLNSIPFSDGKVKLEGVNMRRNKPYAYRITFFGNTVTLKELLGEDKLTELGDLNDNNYFYNSANNLTLLSTDPTANDVVIPLITHTDRLYYDSVSINPDDTNLYYNAAAIGPNGLSWDELKPAIRVDTILRAIESQYDITFSNDFFVSSNAPYYDLFMWVHRKKGDVESPTNLVTRLVDEFTGTLSPDTSTQTHMLNSNTFKVYGDVAKYLAFDINLNRTGTSAYQAVLYKDGVQYYRTADITSSSFTIAKTDFAFTTGEYQIYLEASGTSLPITNFTAEYDVQYDANSNTYTSTSFTLANEFQFIFTQQLPDIKVIDFLTGLFKMFNLVAYIPKSSSEIKVQTLDSFYSSGTSYDITKYVDVDNSQVNVALPYREITFRYEDTDYFFSKDHNERFGKEWGTEEYDGGENDLDGSLYSINVPFAHMKFERIVDANTASFTTVQWGYATNENQEPRVGKPILMYIVRNTGTTISFVNKAGNNNALSTYNIPSNSLDITGISDLDNINFYLETNEYTRRNNYSDTLYNVYYSNYIESVFNTKNRITKITAYLPLRILMNYTLADRFIFNGNSYKINSIKTNLMTGKSEIELLNDL